MALLIIGVIAGLSVMPLDFSSRGQGVVEVSGGRVTIEHRNGGMVSDIYVSEAGKVHQGKVMLSLSSPELVAQEQEMSSQFYGLLAQKERLIAEIKGADFVAEPSEFSNLQGKERALAEEGLKAQRLLFRARKSSSITQFEILANRGSQAGAEFSAGLKQADANRAQRKMISDELNDLRMLVDKGYATRTRLRAVEREAARLDGEYGALLAQISKSNVARSELQLQSLGAGQSRLETAAQLLQEVGSRIDEMRPKLAVLKDEIRGFEIKAPVSGTVFNLSAKSVGKIVQPGQAIMEIVPNSLETVVRAKLTPTSIDSLRVGQKANVRFPGLEGRLLRPLDGIVTAVSADAKTDERNSSTYYDVLVRIPQSELKATLGKSAPTILVPGMPAEVMVILRKRNALEFLLSPLVKSVWRAGREQ